MKTVSKWSMAAIAVSVCVFVTAGRLSAAPPAISSATLTYQIDASDMNNDGGATSPTDGANITAWAELTTGAPLNIQSTPSYQATALNGGPAVRFDGGAAGGDLVFSNNAAIVNTSAQTIYAVASMKADGFILSDLISNSSGLENIRQTTSESAAYFTGNSGDFNFGGTFNINGSQQFGIPGGFDTAHVVRSISPTVANINSLRIGDNANNRIWSGDVAEVLVYNARLSGDDTLAVQSYLSDKHGIAFNTALDDRLLESKQVALNPFQAQETKYIGVNFNYGGPEATGTFNGIGFDNIDLAVPGALTDTYTLTANEKTSGVELTLDLNFTQDNSPRVQSANVTGTDAEHDEYGPQRVFLHQQQHHPSVGRDAI